jgi:hypothetical protein
MIVVSTLVTVFVILGTLGGFLYLIGIATGGLAAFGDQAGRIATRRKDRRRGRRADRIAHRDPDPRPGGVAL